MTNEQLALQNKALFDAASEPSFESIINFYEVKQITLSELKKRNTPTKLKHRIGARLDIYEGLNQEVYLFNQLKY